MVITTVVEAYVWKWTGDFKQLNKNPSHDWDTVVVENILLCSFGQGTARDGSAAVTGSNPRVGEKQYTSFCVPLTIPLDAVVAICLAKHAGICTTFLLQTARYTNLLYNNINV